MIALGRRPVLAALGASAAMGGALATGSTGKARALADGWEEEPALEPGLEIVDPHYHFRDGPDRSQVHNLYLLDDLVADIARSGHRVTAGVFVECFLFYRDSGPEELRTLGETAYIGTVAERAVEQGVGPLVGAMVGKIDLRYGAKVEELIALHQQASGGRLRSVRNSIAYDPYPPYDTMGLAPYLFEHAGFREGLAALGRKGLSFESWLFGAQIPHFTALARDFPDVTMVLGHIGCPLGIGPYASEMDTVYRAWDASMAALAQCPNVLVKVGGLGPFWEPAAGGQPTSAQLAESWQKWIERTVELFGVDRCMFESNYPANEGVSTYGQIWNAFKRVTQGWSVEERAALFSDTARRAYGL